MLRFDLPGLEVGVAEYDEGPTGCTVVSFPERASLSVDVRGGSPGLLGGELPLCDAICLAGGSAYGIEAATGVQAEILAQRNESVAWTDIALVSAGIIFDFGARAHAVYPDKALGRAAFRAARPGVFPLGPRGAGRSATVGKGFDFWEREAAGQGGAFRQIGGVRLAVFTVVNAVGVIVDRSGGVVRGCLDPQTGVRHHWVEGVERRATAAESTTVPGGNTTLTVLVTDARMENRELRQLGRQVHASMARAIQPFHALADGDILFAVSTGQVEDSPLDVTALAAVASELAWDAVLCSFDATD